ncbi:hypothetical protein HWV07_09405 [Natronomonas salina]|uniref:hypothetical protein n=1 Tax=Natronomonas salina TaxID=1710540 RepID=UPI0015B5F866|nr:hypothetical protein [Natronomonas salina]QLD89234.1 hypothetical protein HWV07_09405 [Natronomonas salina]
MALSLRSTLPTGGLSLVALRSGLDGTLVHLGLLLAATPLSRLIGLRRERLVTGGVLTAPLPATLPIGRATLLASLSLELLALLSSRLGIRPSLWRRLSTPGPRRLPAGGLRRWLVLGLRWPLAAGGLGLLALARRPGLSLSTLSTLPSLRFLRSSPRGLLALWRLLALRWLSVLRWLLGLPRNLSLRRSLARRGLGTAVLLPAGRRSVADGLLLRGMLPLRRRSALLTGLLLSTGWPTGSLSRLRLVTRVASGLWRLLTLVVMLLTGLVLSSPSLVLSSRGLAPRPALLDTGLLSTLLLWRRLAALLAPAGLVRAALRRLLPLTWLAGLGWRVLLSTLLLSAPALLVRRLPTARLVASATVLSASALGTAVLLVHVVARLKVRGGAIKRRPPFTRMEPESPR